MELYENFKKELAPKTKKNLIQDLGQIDNKKVDAVRNYLKRGALKDMQRIRLLANYFTDGDVNKLFALCNSKQVIEVLPKKVKV